VLTSSATPRDSLVNAPIEPDLYEEQRLLADELRLLYNTTYLCASTNCAKLRDISFPNPLPIAQ